MWKRSILDLISNHDVPVPLRGLLIDLAFERGHHFSHDGPSIM
jgi:hypothetical protein